MKVSKKSTSNREAIKVTSAEVKNARVVEYNKTDLVFFTLVLNGVTIYDCQIRTSGAGNDFVAFPSHKSKDGKYYNTVYAALSDDDTAMIVELVQTAINA